MAEKFPQKELALPWFRVELFEGVLVLVALALETVHGVIVEPGAFEEGRGNKTMGKSKGGPRLTQNSLSFGLKTLLILLGQV